MLLGAASSGSQMPFWAQSNQFGLMPESNMGVLAVAGAGTSFDNSDTFQWKWGLSLAANSNFEKVNPMVDELYTSFRFKDIPFVLDLGMKHQPVDFRAGCTLSGSRSSLGSLSMSSGHLVWSGNARTLPGYALHLEPVSIPFTDNHLKLYGTFGDYKTIDDRYCRDALIHSTKAYLKYDFCEHCSFVVGLDHYAVWGGNGNTVKMTFSNYFRVVTGRSAGKNGSQSDQINVIGDQGGAELLKLSYDNGWISFAAQHEIPYSDGSGMGFQNFPDGINTLWLGWRNKDRWISDILFEYGYTRYQSGPIHIEKFQSGYSPEGNPSIGIDDYFNNSEYRDGWTYFGRMIGAPLFYTIEKNADGHTLGIRNNRFSSHHFAIAGKLFRKFPYKVMVTQSDNYGTYGNPYVGESASQKPWGSVKETGLVQWSTSFLGEIPLLSSPGTFFEYGFYYDSGKVLEENWGVSFGINCIF